MTGKPNSYEQKGVFQFASPWLAAVRHTMQSERPQVLVDWEAGTIHFQSFLAGDSLWILARFESGGQVAVRAAYSAAGGLMLDHAEEGADTFTFSLHDSMGDQSVTVCLPTPDRYIARITTTLTPRQPLTFPFWPRDLYILDEKGSPAGVEGLVHCQQHASASGSQFISLTRPRSGSLLYFQNFTALNNYCEQTKTSLAYTVGGQWPELGFALPPATQNPLKEGQPVVVSEVYLAFSETVPGTDTAAARLYLDLLAEIYLLLKKPETEYHDWPDRAAKSLQDLQTSQKCSFQVSGNTYLAPYVGATDKPPEVMVQLAAILPLVEYQDWCGTKIEFIDKLMAGLNAFYRPDLKTITRWHSDVSFQDGEREPQEYHEVMDAWYLYHPLLNLARLALRGDENARALFLNSIDFAIEIARQYHYQWPVFYNVETRETILAETSPGKSGETDVACIYVLVMMHAYDLTHDDRFLREAEKAAQSLAGLGFNLLYQINVTAFGMSGLWRLYQETGNQLYCDLTLVCLANVLQNTWLWECDYGYAKSYKSFMGALPLRDAKYLAAFEELETLSAFADVLELAKDELPASARLLMAEFIRYAMDTAWYDFPMELPEEIITEEPKTGEIDRALYMPLEDLYDGVEKAGQVGQEVYGMSGAIVSTVRHFYHHSQMPFTVFTDYPGGAVEIDGEARQMRISIWGDERCSGRVRLLASDGKPLPDVSVHLDLQEQALPARKTPEGHLEFTVPGHHQVSITWK